MSIAEKFNIPPALFETIKKMNAEETEYQMKVKALMKKKGITSLGQLSPEEKKAFFNTLDSMHKAKNEEVELDEAIPKSTNYALVHSSSKKIIAKGNKAEMMKKMKELNAKEKNSHHLGMTNRGKVGDTFGEEVKLEEGKSGTGYELYHKDFSSAMQHAYDFAKKKYNIEIDPLEIDRNVAMGPRKPSSGKANAYRLLDKTGKKAIQVQVANLDNKRYELNMYKEDLDEETTPPFTPDKPKKNPGVVPGKRGVGPSVAKHLAKMAMKKQQEKKPVKEEQELNEDLMKLDPITNTLVAAAVGIGMTMYTLKYWFSPPEDLRKPIEKGLDKAEKAGNAKLYHSLAAKYHEDIAAYYQKKLDKLKSDPSAFYKKDSLKTGAKAGDMKRFEKVAQDEYLKYIKKAKEKAKMFSDREKSGAPIAKGTYYYESVKHVAEQTELNESHFKVGQRVECIKSGMKGTVVKKDTPEEGKYYTVKQDSGKMMKYAPDELKAISDKKVEEASSPAQQAAIAIAMKKAGKTPKNMKEEQVMVCKDCGDEFDKPTTDCPHDSHDPNGKNWVKKEMNEEIEQIDEGLSAAQISKLRDAYASIDKIDVSGQPYKQLVAFLDKQDLKTLKMLAGAKIKFISGMAQNRVVRKMNESIGSTIGGALGQYAGAKMGLEGPGRAHGENLGRALEYYARLILKKLTKEEIEEASDPQKSMKRASLSVARAQEVIRHRKEIGTIRKKREALRNSFDPTATVLEAYKKSKMKKEATAKDKNKSVSPGDKLSGKSEPIEINPELKEQKT